MRIRLDFAEANKYLFEPFDFNIVNSSALMNILGEELKQVLIDDYFNGSDFAVNYIGYSLDNEYFELELIPG